MATVAEHYEQHLGPIYVWMAGGIDAALKTGGNDIDALDLAPVRDAVAVDLGAGFGMHAIPLARRGYRVVAIDNCAELLRALDRERGDLPVVVVEADLLAFRRHLPEAPALIVCLGDTLTHLADEAAVRVLVAEAFAALPSGGTLVFSFRDYTTALTAEQRFIPVRSDADRILTCFLDYGDTHVTVNDIVHERTGEQWRLRVSSYQKLRLAPDWVVRCLESADFSVRRRDGARGMVWLVARRA
jgi:SAM-dependent methyltransferase